MCVSCVGCLISRALLLKDQSMARGLGVVGCRMRPRGEERSEEDSKQARRGDRMGKLKKERLRRVVVCVFVVVGGMLRPYPQMKSDDQI